MLFYQGFEDMALPEPAPRNLPKNEDPKLVNRNRRMLGNLLGTLEVFVTFHGLSAFVLVSSSLFHFRCVVLYSSIFSPTLYIHFPSAEVQERR